MATLIPSIGTCVSRMTSGERRLAERLEQKLDDDYLLWYDVPVGPRHLHPDFVVMHPRRGLLILEVKDWRLGTIQRADKQNWEIIPDGIPKSVINPLEQARQYAHQVVNALERDKQLVHENGKYQGKLAFPWSYGVVFTNISRKQFQDAELHNAIDAHRVICQDEMLESVGAEDLQSRLWDMFPYMMGGIMSLPQLDRVRWIMFPEVRVQTQGALFTDSDEGAELPDIMRVMDLQQEQLARSLGDGHRVIHGVAGSGKTMILGYRAEYLAKAHTPASKPILILCYNEPLAVKLASVMEGKGLGDKVHARHFHKWCRDQLVTYGQTLPGQVGRDKYVVELVQRVIHGVDRKQIPSGQYRAILIDEGHDFQPEWLKLVTQMVDPTTNSLPSLRDEAYAIAEQLSNAHKEGHAWGDMAILCPDYQTRDLCAQVLHQHKLPVQMRKGPGDFDPGSDTIKVMTMKVSKGLEFPVVALPATREYLSNLSHDKCWYSEARESVSRYQVDHFRPHGRAKQALKTFAEGYSWLAFDIENFRLAGVLCNTANQEYSEETVGKADWFPLLDPDARATLKARDCSHESPILLDPVDPDDPGKLIFNEDGAVRPHPDLELDERDRVQLAIECLGLSQSQLDRARRKIWRDCLRRLTKYTRIARKPKGQRTEEERLTLLELTGELTAMSRASSEFSAVARCCLRANRLEKLVVADELLHLASAD